MAIVKLNQSALKEMLSGPKGMVAADVQRRTNAVLRQAIKLCPVGGGRLSQSIKMEMYYNDPFVIGRVGTNVEYALYVHEGTGLFGPRRRYIVPVNKKALRWARVNNSGQGRRRYKGGATEQWTYSMRSKGTPGRPFLRDALNAAR